MTALLALSCGGEVLDVGSNSGASGIRESDWKWGTKVGETRFAGEWTVVTRHIWGDLGSDTPSRGRFRFESDGRITLLEEISQPPSAAVEWWFDAPYSGSGPSYA